ncbi:hypothetical protein [Phaeocystidibacter luteus]|uniref:hypothetical protein n=1 Tax=Phaeocystidibacter luteus TaxID=911197 RepID=UPI001478F6D4|nr:hypothetical protein [Phaeocystidibacter luteus]
MKMSGKVFLFLFGALFLAIVTGSMTYAYVAPKVKARRARAANPEEEPATTA